MAEKEALKGILMGLADFAQNQADTVKWKAKLALTEDKQKKNWLWQLQEKSKMEMKQKKTENLMTENLVKRLRGKSEDTGLGVDLGPEVRAGKGGESDVYYPSAKDKEFRIKQGLNRIRLKEEKGMPLTPIEKKFKENYSGLYDKEKELTPYQQEQMKQNQNKATGAIQAMLKDNVPEEDIISATMASTGLDVDWVKSAIEEMKVNVPQEEGLFQKGAKGLANIFNFGR